MAQKYTHQDFLNKLKEKNKKIIPLETYVNSTTKILFQCEICKYQWRAAPAQVLYKTGCPECKKNKLSNLNVFPKEEYEKQLREIRPTLSIYANYNGLKQPVDLICDKGHIWHVSRAHLALTETKNFDCPYCNHKKFSIENSVFYQRPDLIKYFLTPELAKETMPHSMIKQDFICPNCGHIKNMSIDNLSTKGFNCLYCKTDNISYPNRILRAFFFDIRDQFDNADFNLEWSLSKYRFDGQFIKNNQCYVIEMQGMQHYQETFPFLALEDQKKRDNEKRLLCVNNKIKEFEINCSNSDFDFIKNNLILSLNSILDLSNVDWGKVKEQASLNLIKESVKLKKQNYTIDEISKQLKLSQTTIKKYLKEAKELNWIS